MTMTARQQKLALDLLDVGAFLMREASPGGYGFPLKRHETHPQDPLSPFKLHLRTPDHPTNPGPLTPELVDRIAQEMRNITGTKGIRCDAFIGVPRAGEPFAKAFQNTAPRAYGQILLKMSKGERGDGTRMIGDTIEGAVGQDFVVLVFDDVVTEADSKLEAIATIKRYNMKVQDIIVAVDRQQGGSACLRSECRLHAVFQISKLLRLYAAEGRIGNDFYEECMTYLGLTP